MKKKKKYYRYKDSHRTVRGVKQKRCTMCEKWKPESDFHKDRARKDGLKIRCKKCSGLYEREIKTKNGTYLGKNLKFEQRHRTFRGVKQKLCRGCNRWKKEDQFYKNRGERDGLDSLCRNCQNNHADGDPGHQRRVVRRNLRYEQRHRVVRGIREKLCSRCGKWKKENQFYKQRSSPDGIGGHCRECGKKQSRKRYSPKRDRLRRYFGYEQRHRSVNGVKEKFCRKCRRWKKESEFYSNRSAKDGLDSRCKKCAYTPAGKASE